MLLNTLKISNNQPALTFKRAANQHIILLSMQTLSVDDQICQNISKLRTACIEPEYFRLHNTIQYIQERSQPAYNIAFNAILKVQTLSASHQIL